jgi:hypothetical protein
MRKNLIALSITCFKAEWARDGTMGLLDQLTEEAPGFARDLLFSTLEAPHLGHCRSCSPYKLVPLEAIQFKCSLPKVRVERITY